MEATRALEALKVTYRSNMHMVSKVIEVTGFKSGAIFIVLSPLIYRALALLLGFEELEGCLHQILIEYALGAVH